MNEKEQDRIDNTYDEYYEGMSKIVDVLVKEFKVPKDLILVCLNDGNLNDEQNKIVEENKIDDRDIMESWSAHLGKLKEKIEKKYNVEIDHEEHDFDVNLRR